MHHRIGSAGRVPRSPVPTGKPPRDRRRHAWLLAVAAVALGACAPEAGAPPAEPAARPTAEQHRAACETLLQHVERVAAVLRAAVAGEVAPEQGRQQIAALQPDGDAAVQQRKRLGAADSPEVVAVYSELEPRRRRAFEEFNQLCLRLTGKNALLTAAQGQVFASIEALVAKPR